jgi:spore photoproduct lyase
MNKNIIYIEQDIATHPNTLKVLEKFANAQCVYIKHYKDFFNQSNNDWRSQKASQKIILAKRTQNFYYKGADITPDFGHHHFYYNTLALNCVYDCDYCYLQGLFPSAHLVLFVNNEDFIVETKKLLTQIDEPVYFALSYDTDLLALEHWLPYCKEWIDFASQENNLTVEIRTKSANIKAIDHCASSKNIILAWTLSPQQIASQYEPATPSTQLRMNAIKAAVEKGWRVRICIDPILKLPDWKKDYGQMIEDLSESVNFAQLDSFSVGVFRMNKKFLKNIQHQRSDAGILYDRFELKNDVYSYSDDVKKEMFSFIEERIKSIYKDIRIEVL